MFPDWHKVDTLPQQQPHQSTLLAKIAEAASFPTAIPADFLDPSQRIANTA
jgi:hypothetical protein